MKTVLRIDASARYNGSYSRQLGDRLIDQLKAKYPGMAIIHRDLAKGVPFVNEAMVVAYNTSEDKRTAEQKEVLKPSNELVDELFSSDALVITTPIYNFSVPASLKAYIDLVCRGRLTFRYSSDGPVGLLSDRKTYLVIASGGTRIDSDIDFATGYLKHVLGFIGIRDVEVIAGDRLMSGPEERLAQTHQQIEQAIATLV
ncbi:MAG: FMN-dependent NADH-azoreductase [Merismopedia sp. SIO2A8]|nr:FMN-dependent NADH-azoreductase [Symploca sp. SIO2B6]NET51130.1 FMN-dependent NADH-azoreductase [Merismopedia sp. SIO2A8]